MRGRFGDAAGAVGVVGRTGRFDLSEAERRLRSTAHAISGDLAGYRADGQSAAPGRPG